MNNRSMAAMCAVAALALTGCGDIGSRLPNPIPGKAAATGYANGLITSGATNPVVTQDRIRYTICVPGWSSTVRPPSSLTQRLEREQIKLYRYKDTNPESYTMDHLLPISIGGAVADPRNIFPQPVEAAKEKDVLERKLHKQVCDGTKTLAEAQAEMLEEWRR